ncbi:hypothetical protein [Spirosoma sp. KNUC1025]|uniref:hypothetical protein n=1 Tax=Spirosoma sp. KNUC1025 TaxID=2894082 RepID=UPI00386601E6|nr:hypothetical protein LN737_20610 [Spirosoma sp. KNUC1025]
MSLHLYRLGSLAVLFLLLGCQPTPTEPVMSDHDYFPLETGRYVIYDVQQEQYALNSAPTLKTYQLKEVIGTTYTDVTVQTAYRLMRYRRLTESQPWQADSVWSARIINNEVVRTENGRDLVKLLLPVNGPEAWNGNRHNSSEPDDYVTRNIGLPYDVLGKQYSETVTVVEQDDSTLTMQDKRIAVYARQIGLIYKEQTQLQFCTATPACTGHSQIDYGIRQVYRIRTYGKE